MSLQKRTFNLFSVSEARNVIFGIATLWIGLFHSAGLSLAPYFGKGFLNSCFVFVRSKGNVGVDMFLLLSGIGLYFSFSNDSNIKNFWKKRLMRVLPTALLIGTIYFSIRYITGRESTGLLFYLSRVSFLHFFFTGERVFWFISLILVLYLLFPLIYKAIVRFGGKGTAVMVVGIVVLNFLLRWLAPSLYSMWEVALCRIPVFIVGIWLGRYIKEKREISRKWLWAFLGAAILMIVYLYFLPRIRLLINPAYDNSMEQMYMFLYRYAGSVLAVMLVLLDSFVITAIRRTGHCNVLRNIFEFIGLYSMEYYMIYLNLIHYLERIYKPFPAYHQPMLCVGCCIISIVLCVAARKFCDFFMTYMQKKPKKTTS